MPFQAVTPGTEGIGHSGDAQQALVFALVHTAEPAFQALRALFEVNRQGTLDQRRPALQQLSMALQQVRQRLDQLRLQGLTEPGQR
ncbi:hypothetical protein WR25_10396 [Diploscapter pachys]|uniref:Uncharacterized protein n=1 Tax=Diploscapter pachys TaxID=2018661 RepID=A0A2A2KI37_9BILA|nr:hypothetical protein WR25_10396 [Diploscapter pachys]